MSYSNDETPINNETEYTDEEMLLAAQSAYLNITEDDIKQYQRDVDPNGYPTL